MPNGYNRHRARMRKKYVENTAKKRILSYLAFSFTVISSLMRHSAALNSSGSVSLRVCVRACIRSRVCFNFFSRRKCYERRRCKDKKREEKSAVVVGVARIACIGAVNWAKEKENLWKEGDEKVAQKNCTRLLFIGLIRCWVDGGENVLRRV